ncbi:MAG TPA: STAS domain-containing protein [Burkholderiaceae bacterium]|nr:STAS domain-containing protein [Burkholderiaceae bacterium]
MATKDNSPGLLSKVAMFVRNPTTNWSDLDQMETSTDSAFSKQALKEMIERKRQNDFVRKREFDQLRKLRKRGAADLAAEVGRPSFFHSSLSSTTDDRASTLKKIDEIEAHMSKQWWKGKQEDDTPVPRGAVPVAPGAKRTPADSESAPETIAPDPGASDKYAATEAASLDARPHVRSAREFSDTQPGAGLSGSGVSSQDARSSLQSRTSSDSRQGGISAIRPPNSEIGGAGFSTSKLYAGESDDAGTDPELEEAAIRFANGDDAGAESGLLSALRGDTVSRDSADLWTGALFDLYRATGQHAKFDGVAVEFAERFGRSAPAWFSIPDQVGRSPRVLEATDPEPAADTVSWTSPATLTVASVDALRLALANEASPWHLDWTTLVSMQVDAMAPLGRLFASWCTQPVELRFSGADALEKVLRPLTISGDKASDPSWWRLRMDALRIMRRQDEFELVALDFCVTYEVSPPAWQLPKCGYVEDNLEVSGEASLVNAGGSGVQRSDSGYEMTLRAGLDGLPVPESVLVELVGELRGDAAPALETLESRRQGSQRLVVSCSKLIRVDFAAAGTILNWVAEREGEGCQIQFRDMHRLVATFFNVIGIHEHASVIRRMT